MFKNYKNNDLWVINPGVCVSVVESKEVKVEDPEWEEQGEGTVIEFKKEGDEVTGVLIALEKDIGPHKSKLYSLKQENGEVFKVWGSKVLDSRMAAIDFGTEIKIKYIKQEKPEKGNAYKVFSVYKKRGD